ncbi:uncharacterized protein LOC131293704 [Anopheles ziemanni]|uniref:uncharacterized protein LOC131264488 n=1 Tax=Anopheles coustani TaxID=139045 RepID=UPI002657E3D6|nr:uncharacterized protein LOC131264488 [Anopheles coustani]XP_058177762.1 uncharacterized protein LOC131293704 [Anopheles ziemanni]
MGESIKEYLERMDIFFDVNEVESGKKTVMLLTLGGASLYSLISKMVLPEKRSSVPYEKLVIKLKEQLEQKVNVVAERFNFRNCIQKNQSVAEYIVELKALAQTCEFKCCLVEALRDQLVAGVRDDGLRKRLLRETGLTFEGAESIARTWEAADEQNEAFTRKEKGGEMAAIRSAPKRSVVSKSHYYRGSGAPVKPSNDNNCHRCGRSHNPQTCPARTWQCFTCKNLKKYLLDTRYKPLSLQRKLNQILFKYRNSPCTVTKVTPSERVFCYVPHTVTAKVNPIKGNERQMSTMEESRSQSKIVGNQVEYEEEESVFYRNHFKEHMRWIPAIVKKKISGLRYLISLNGIIRMVHKNQLRKNKNQTSSKDVIIPSERGGEGWGYMTPEEGYWQVTRMAYYQME